MFCGLFSHAGGALALPSRVQVQLWRDSGQQHVGDEKARGLGPGCQLWAWAASFPGTSKVQRHNLIGVRLVFALLAAAVAAAGPARGTLLLNAAQVLSVRACCSWWWCVGNTQVLRCLFARICRLGLDRPPQSPSLQAEEGVEFCSVTGPVAGVSSPFVRSVQALRSFAAGPLPLRGRFGFAHPRHVQVAQPPRRKLPRPTLQASLSSWLLCCLRVCLCTAWLRLPAPCR